MKRTKARIKWISNVLLTLNNVQRAYATAAVNHTIVKMFVDTMKSFTLPTLVYPPVALRIYTKYQVNSMHE